MRGSVVTILHADSIIVKESDILHAVRCALRADGWFVIRNQQSMGSHKGLADLTAIKDGRVVFIEIKRADGKMSVHQERFEADIKEHGGEYMVARCLDDIKPLLEGVMF